MSRTTISAPLAAHAAALVIASAVVGCGSGGGDGPGSTAADVASDVEAVRSLPHETFHWGDQPISFAPLPATWERHRAQSGGEQGVYFVKRGSVGERIGVAEYTRVGERDRCVELVALLRDLDTLDFQEFDSRQRRARPYGRPPIHAKEKLAFAAANENLDSARENFRDDNLFGARRQIASAISRLSYVEYDLDDVIDDVIFTGEGWEREGPIDVQPPRAGVVAGLPARIVDFTHFNNWKGREFRGRRVYFVHGNHLFTADFLGLEENLPLFEAMLETISFPKGECVR